VAGRSIEVIDAGQAVAVGRLRTSEGNAVAAVCCCRRKSRLTLKRQVILPTILSMPWRSMTVYEGHRCSSQVCKGSDGVGAGQCGCCTLLLHRPSRSSWCPDHLAIAQLPDVQCGTEGAYVSQLLNSHSYPYLSNKSQMSLIVVRERSFIMPSCRDQGFFLAQGRNS
jgi:hypothetical protein